MLLLIGAIFLIALIDETRCYADIQQREDFIKRHNLHDVKPCPPAYRIIKRFCDIVLSLSVCILILPILYIVLGLIIKLTSKGPIIFKQTRYGLLGKKFTCYKFRSMYQNASAERVLCQEDERITPIGRFMRKTHLDEFPQFFNVLKGDMSLVGPRPHSIKGAEKYAVSNKNYYRLLVRPGITGLTQINSGRELSVEKHLQYDAFYVENPSLIQDLGLIIKTMTFSDVSY